MTSEGPNPFEAFSAFSGVRDAYLDAWSKMMVEMVNSEAYAEANAKLLDNYLNVSAPFRETVERAMTNTLTHLNMPTRTDVTTLAERLTNIELKLDDLDAKIDTLSKAERRGTKNKARTSA